MRKIYKNETKGASKQQDKVKQLGDEKELGSAAECFIL